MKTFFVARTGQLIASALFVLLMLAMPKVVWAAGADENNSGRRAIEATLEPSSAPVPAATPSPVPTNPAILLESTVGVAGKTPNCTNASNTTIKVPANTVVVYCHKVTNNSLDTFVKHSVVDSILGVLFSLTNQPLLPQANLTKSVTATISVSTTNFITWTVSNTNVNQVSAAVPDETANVRSDAAEIISFATAKVTVLVSGPNDDQDGDSIPDNLESAQDVDGDNTPNFLDTDSDNDNKSDLTEVGADPRNPVDSDLDGTPDYLDSVNDPISRKVFLPVVTRQQAATE